MFIHHFSSHNDSTNTNTINNITKVLPYANANICSQFKSDAYTEYLTTNSSLSVYSL